MQRLRHLPRAHVLFAGEIRDRARHAQREVHAAGALPLLAHS
jgi:hypothetical protein